jgi:uncharacterized protein
MAAQELFHKHQYISLETFRKTGEGVRTPVWFAQDGDRLFVFTQGNSGKVKRIRRSGRVRIAPSDQGGKPLGEYIDGEAVVAPFDSELFTYGNKLMDKKYGLMKKAFELMNRNKAERVIIEIRLA